MINQEVYASVDIDFLREAVNNLVENAIKYTASGGGIWVNVRGDDDRVLINVTDTGIGISPDDLKHVFQKFYRADNSQTRTVGGTGLGLYLVKQQVEAMGGKVWAESSFGEGSTFYLSFPRITAEEYQRRKQIASNIGAMNLNTQSVPAEPTLQTPQPATQEAAQAVIQQPTIPQMTTPQAVVTQFSQPVTPQPTAVQPSTQQIVAAQPATQQPTIPQIPTQQTVMMQFSQPVTPQPPVLQQPALSQPASPQPMQPLQQPAQLQQSLQSTPTQSLNSSQTTDNNQQLPTNN